MQVMTVVELDLVGYSSISAMLEDGIDAGTVAQLNEQIQSFVDVGLKAVGASRCQAVVQTTGDGAILLFAHPADAHRFAAAVHAATRDHNRHRQRAIGKRVFRVGVATGELHLCPRADGGSNPAGTTIARAVRLEAKAPPGGVLVDEATFAGLDPDQQAEYREKARVTGKRDEVFDARLAVLNPDGEADAAHFREAAPAPRRPAPDESEEVDAEELLRALLTRGRVAEAPSDLDRAIHDGFAGVDNKLKAATRAGRPGLEQIRGVIDEAISHGAGIYNHSPAGRVGCGRIYHKAAVGLSAGTRPPTGGSVPRGAELALDWLRRIVTAVPQVIPDDADDLAWELRFAFDSTSLIGLCDSIADGVWAAAGRPDAAAHRQLIGEVLAVGRKLSHAHEVAYLLQHTARVYLSLPTADRVLGDNRTLLRHLADERVTRETNETIVNRLRQLLVQLGQGTADDRSGWWGRLFGRSPGNN